MRIISFKRKDYIKKKDLLYINRSNHVKLDKVNKIK